MTLNPPISLLKSPHPPWQSTSKPVSSLRIIFTNDTQEDWEKMSSLVKGFSLYSKEGKLQGQDVIRLNGGNNNAGNGYRDWELTVLLNNLLGLHASGIGNLDLDLQFRDYLKGLNLANYPTLCANLTPPTDPGIRAQIGLSRIQTRALIVQGDHGQYGLLGISAPKLPSMLANPNTLEGVNFQEFNQACQSLQQEVDRLQAHGINRIILLSHMKPILDELLAKKVSGIDVIVGASGGIPPKSKVLHSPTGETVLLLQNGRHGGKTLFGVADILFDSHGHPVAMSSNNHDPKFFEKDPEAERLIYRYLGLPKPLALVLNSYCNCGVHHQDDPVAQFAADSMRSITGAEIALVRSSEIRDGINSSILTDRKLHSIMPFDEPVVTLQLLGSELLSILQQSAQGQKQGGTAPLLHPSGLAYMIAPQQGQVLYPSVFNRQISQWEPVHPDKVYTVAVGAYAVQNATEFPALAQPERVVQSTQMPLRTVFEWGLQQAGAPLKPLRFVADGRVRILK